MDVIKRLGEIYEEVASREQMTLQKISLPDEKHLYIGNFWSINESRSLYHLTIKSDLINAKQCFYLCGRNDEYVIKVYDEDMLSWAGKHMGYALLSDCLPLIERYASLTESKFERIKGQGHFVYCMQCALKEDWAELDKQIIALEKRASAKSNKWMIPDLTFFKGLRSGNIAMMEEGIQELVKPRMHKKWNDFFIIQREFLSFPAISYAKLAWLKGFEVQVDSPLVPKELLPHRPNAEYVDSYEFLKELDGEIKPDKPEVKMMEGLSYKDYKPKPTKIITYENTLLAFKEAARDNINLTEDEFKKLADMAWLAYTDPKAFDKEHIAYLREVGWGSHTFIDDVKYLYEHPLQHLWTLFKTDQDYYIEVIAQFVSAHFFNDSDYDFMLETTVGKLLTEAGSKKSIKEKLAQWWSKN